MTIHLDPAITPTVSSNVPRYEGDVIVELGPDFTLHVSEQQAADLIDALTAHLHDRTAAWSVTPEGAAWLETLNTEVSHS